MGNGVGLDTAFNQDPPTQNINTHAKQDKQAEGLKDEKKNLNLERIYDAKIGETVSYNATTGTIVRKDGSYVTIYNEGNNAFDQVHAGQTSISTDTIGSGITAQLWDQMRQEQRIASLNKAHVEEPLHFISRKWSELPMNLKDVLKLKPTRNTPSSPTRNQEPLGGSDDSGSPYKKPKYNEYDPEHNDLELGLESQQMKKANPDSEPGKKMPGTASNKPVSQTMTPGGKNVLIGNTGNKLNTGRSSTTTGTKVPVKVGGKTYMVTERQRDTWHKNTTEGQRGDKKFTTQFGDKLSGKKTGIKQDSTYKPDSATSGPGTYKDGIKISGPGVKTKPTTTKKPGGSAGAATNSVKPAGTKNLTGSTSGTTAGSTAAGAAARRSTSSPTPPRQSEGVTFATGLDKANNYSDLTTAIYRIRNNINKVKLSKPKVGAPDKSTVYCGDKDTFVPGKGHYDSETDKVIKVQSSTPNATPFGKIPGTGRDAGNAGAVPPVGGTKFFSDSGKGPFKSQKEADASTPRKQRNISAERTARAEYNAKPGQTVANRLDENKSDVEHGAYGGVVTDTPFDASEDYEEDREEVHGKEFDHNHQQKTPRDPKEDGKEVMVGFHNKEGDGGAVTTGTPGANNPRYNPKYDPDEDGYKEKSIVNKNNSRYGIRKASKEDIERLTK
jgi:hypothetical protein